MRVAAAFRTTNAPTATLPGGSLYSATGAPLVVFEFGVFNTTTNACTLSLVRLTSAGTVGATITEAPFDTEHTALGTAFNSHTVGPTLGAVLRTFSIGAAIGAGAVFTFDAKPIVIPTASGSGIGVVSVGTGQIVDLYFDYEE